MAEVNDIQATIGEDNNACPFLLPVESAFGQTRHRLFFRLLFPSDSQTTNDEDTTPPKIMVKVCHA